MEFENGTGMADIASTKAEYRAHGSATILAIGTANPPNCYHQATYPDYYFRVTKSEHKFDLKNKFKRFCERSMVKKRFMTVTEEMLRANPSIVDPTVPSLNTRLDLDTSEVPKLGAEAATKAIKEWGQPMSKITHLVFHSSSGMALPGADYQLAKILELDPSVKRFLLCPLGCYAGVTALRLAKDLAENNPGARVLVVCSEVTVSCFHAPSSDHMGMLVGHAIFGEGAGAAIVGAEVNTTTERRLYQMVSATQTFVPDTEEDVGGLFRDGGLIYRISKKLTTVVADNFDKCVVEAFKPIVGTISDWNSLFWAVHPGGPAILNRIEEKLGLKHNKLRASRNVLSEYGNMWSSTVFFVLDEMRKTSLVEGKTTTGEGLQWGVLLGFGPGVTVETIVLHSVPQPQLAYPVTI